MKGVESATLALTSNAGAVSGTIGGITDGKPEKRATKSRNVMGLPETRVDIQEAKETSGDDEEDAVWLRRRQADVNGNATSVQDDRLSVSSHGTSDHSS